MSWTPRDHASFVHAFLASLPEGPVWPRHPTSVLVKVVTGLMLVVERWALRVARFLLVEAFPPTSLDLLPDWERVLGLPEPCLPAAVTIPERQRQVREKLARRPGRQDRAYFIARAAELGYAITITEYRPAQCGVSQCGPGWGVGTPFIRFLWTVTVPGARLTWFACGVGGGRAGQDPHLRIARAEDLECLFRLIMPAHTKLIFDYSGV